MTEPKLEAKAGAKASSTLLADNPLWYQDAIIYELHVRAFQDSDGDGIGDFVGLTRKLDYLQDLGVTALWLLPFYPSPLKDDGYDIADYTDVHPAYGSLRDFNVFLREAHRRGLRVITELVLNHTSNEHPWFKRARREKPSSPYRQFYVWSESPEKYRDARVIFKDFETSNWAWDPIAKAYYWHRFYSHQPDLNYENPLVVKAVKRVLDFWLGLGVDGLRLDAVPYLFEKEGTNCENLPETHDFLKALRRHVDARFKNRMFLGEANQWPEDAAKYFGSGDECQIAFHFPLMPRLFMALRKESRQPIVDILEQTPEISKVSQWAIFLRNHDELTLEMVTDEERDYMYRAFAQEQEMRINLGIRRRLAPLLGFHRRTIELLNGLLLSLPGTPVIYYGDEIGMGDNVYLGDRNGVRTPMQWSADQNAGFSHANPQRLYLPIIIDPASHYEAVNVETQEKNPHSLLRWMKRILAIRARHTVFGRGSFKLLIPQNPKVLAFVRAHEGEIILVVANLSRFVQYATLDLSAYKGALPVELFGRTEFPAITDAPYTVTLGPHSFYWFSLESAGGGKGLAEMREPGVPVLETSGRWQTLFRGKSKRALEDLLPSYLAGRRWFAGKARTVLSAEIVEVIVMRPQSVIALVRVHFVEGEPDLYSLPLSFITGERAAKVKEVSPGSVLSVVRESKAEGLLVDAVYDTEFCRFVLGAIEKRRVFKGSTGELASIPTPALRALHGLTDAALEPRVLGSEQSNTSIVYGELSIFKLFRRVQEGMNPDLEIGKFLTERTAFKNVPPVAGYLEFKRGERGEPLTLGVLQGYAANQGDTWSLALDALSRFYERALASVKVSQGASRSGKPLIALVDEPVSSTAIEMIGPYLDSVSLLGKRTAELHQALALSKGDPAFDPEPFTPFYQRAMYQSMSGTVSQGLELLRKHQSSLTGAAGEKAQRLLTFAPEVAKRFNWLRGARITAQRIRCHGDYHLGQVLATSGKDFVIMDFEGEPERSLTERRLKRSPLSDVAGMIRSFHYAASVAYLTFSGNGGQGRAVSHAQDLALVEPWSALWYEWVSAAFLKSYIQTAREAAFLPRARDEVRNLLDSYLLERAFYELSYELNNRPDWAGIPLQAILDLVSDGA
ncbi:MAG: maltose alpha-D-glucosyltransferase [Candidatus Omnitrophica bacterium]|nr:maltose alpha-D-glucosyltransferase [Candidatus Omnitrophota bacterium]